MRSECIGSCKATSLLPESPPESNDESIILRFKVWFGAVVVAHRVDDAVAYSHAMMLYIAVVAENLFEQFVPCYSNNTFLHFLDSDTVWKSSGRNNL